MAAQPPSQLTSIDVRNLPLSVPLWPIAAKAHGLGRDKAFDLARRQELPFPVLRLGRSYRVNRADLLRSLGIDPERMPAA